jgi:predicted transcriptional regulator
MTSNSSSSLTDQTTSLVEQAKDISVTGAIQAFDEEFKLMQNNIDEIRKILSSVNFTQADIQEIENMLDNIK